MRACIDLYRIQPEAEVGGMGRGTLQVPVSAGSGGWQLLSPEAMAHFLPA